jgi:sec-independent protein translocase protein TatC
VDETQRPLTEHLAELRRRLFRLIAAWGLAAAATWWFREEVFGFLMAPAIDALGTGGTKLQAISPPEIFFTYVKCALLSGFVVALPVIFWEIWAFVAPGLYPTEKRYALPFVVASTLLFVGGGGFGYALVFPLVYQFFASYQTEFVQAAWTMREVFSFTTHMFLAFGVCFELPILIFFLALVGLVDAAGLMRNFKYAVLGAFIVGAVLTPADMVSQFMLAVPLVFLYLLGVGLAWMFGTRRKAAAESELSRV